jgi:hypothetical protein
MGFADVPKEIRRARKSKGVQTPSPLQNGESSNVSNGIDDSPRRQPSIQALAADAPHQTPLFPTSDRDLNRDETISKRSTSLSDTCSEDLYADSTHSPEAGGTHLDSTISGTSTSGEPTRKKDYRILQTSNGVVLGASKAIGKIIVAGLLTPFELSLSATRGFHNVPKFYGDDTVRPHERITGVRSGLKAAGKVSSTQALLLNY